MRFGSVEGTASKLETGAGCCRLVMSTIHYQKVKRPKIDLPSRPASQGYIRSPRDMQTYVPDHAATVNRKHGHNGHGGKGRHNSGS